MIARVERITFFLLIFSIISQFGRHFWPSFSTVSGIRVDYLSPTLYVSDILILCLAALVVIRVIGGRGEKFHSLLKTVVTHKIFLLFLFVIFLSTWFSHTPAAAMYGVIKLIEFLFVGVYIAATFHRKQISTVIRILTFSAIIVAAIAIIQFFLQHSIGVLFYLLGERTFSESTIGIATTSLFNTQLLRPYATFPHPNVLAFFLFLVNTLLLFRLTFERGNWRYIYFATIIISSIALLLTLSRVLI